MTDTPWPKYPCCPCSSGCGNHVTLDGEIMYGEADGYYWHTAMWDHNTGRWVAECHNGHRKRGTKRLVKKQRRSGYNGR